MKKDIGLCRIKAQLYLDSKFGSSFCVYNPDKRESLAKKLQSGGSVDRDGPEITQTRCRRCGSPMDEYIPSRGYYAGRTTFRCSKHPKCKHTEGR